MRRAAVRFAAVAGLALGVLGCSRAAQADLSEVISGTADRGDYLHVTVTDVRTGDELLVELSDGDETVWASGFDRRPARGSSVWTSITGAGVRDDQLGLVYPSAGALEAPDRGLTEAGTVGVLVGAVALLGLLVPVGVGLVVSPKPSRACSSCRTPLDEEWITCPACGAATGRAPEPAPAPAAAPLAGTVVRARDGEDTAVDGSPTAAQAQAPAPAPPESAPRASEAQAPAAPDPRSAGTRIFRRDE